MKLESKIWNVEPANIQSLHYDYQEKEKFLNEASNIVDKILKAYGRLHFTREDTSVRKAIWMLHVDALSTIDDCIDLLKNRRFRIVSKLLRDIFESVDLATLFWLTRHDRKKYLDKWYQDKTMSHSLYRKHLEGKLHRTQIAKDSKKFYRLLSEYTHHNYSALLDSYILARKNRLYFHDEKGLPLLPQKITDFAWILGKIIATLVYYSNLILQDKEIIQIKEEFENKGIFRYCTICSF